MTRRGHEVASGVLVIFCVLIWILVVFSVQKFMELYTYDLCIVLYGRKMREEWGK